MEHNGHVLLGSDHRETAIPVEINGLQGNGWCFDGFGDYTSLISSNQSFEGPSMLSDQSLNWSPSELHCPFADNSSVNKLYWPPFPYVEDRHVCQPCTDLHNAEPQASSKLEPKQTAETPNSNLGFCPERESEVKKKDGRPSKNLMAERRRRKRLNDRLLMLRSVVPKISKMDRKSILVDAIDYMNELLEKISNLQEEIEVGSIQFNSEPNEVLVRNSPKFEVERRDKDTRIEISCGGKPGLLLSTLTTLEELGLEIEQCVVSCFNDFAMQASCSETLEQRGCTTSADIMEALSKNAGHEGVFRD